MRNVIIYNTPAISVLPFFYQATVIHYFSITRTLRNDYKVSNTTLTGGFPVPRHSSIKLYYEYDDY